MDVNPFAILAFMAPMVFCAIYGVIALFHERDWRRMKARIEAANQDPAQHDDGGE